MSSKLSIQGFKLRLNVQLQVVRELLGKPAYEGPQMLLYEADAISALQQLPDSMFPLTVTSPPYNIGKEYEVVLPLSEYLDWTEKWIREVYRVTNSVGAFWLNLGYLPIPQRGRAVPLPYLVWDRVPFFLVQEIVWYYGAGVANRHSFSPRNEKFLWYVKNLEQYVFNLEDVRDPNVKYPNQKKGGKLRVNPRGKNPTDVWQIPKVTTGEGLNGRRASKERTTHPAQFPEAVIARIIRACSNPGDIVLDPFMGSGTTAKVALELGRFSVGFEINAHYIDIAVKRLEAFIEAKQKSCSQPRLIG